MSAGPTTWSTAAWTLVGMNRSFIGDLRFLCSGSVAARGRPYTWPAMARQAGEKLIVDNRRARHEYHLGDRFEAGLVLQGTEVKVLRGGEATLQRAYAEVRDGEA